MKICLHRDLPECLDKQVIPLGDRRNYYENGRKVSEMQIPVYQWNSGKVREQDIPIPTIGGKPSKGEVYRLRKGIMQEKLDVPAMNLLEFMAAYPDAICKKIIASTEPAVYQFESPEHGVAIYLQHNPS